MYAASPHGAARLPPDGHLRSACRRGKKSKATSKAEAEAEAEAEADQKIAAFGSSYTEVGVFSWKLVGCQAAIAGVYQK